MVSMIWYRNTLFWSNIYVCSCLNDCLINMCMTSRAIELYPKGSKTEDYNKWVSIFLTAADCETLKEDEKIFTQAYLRILDPRGSNHLSRSSKSYNTVCNNVFKLTKV